MSELVKCPAVASAILNLFGNQRDYPAIAGDLAEEFRHRVQREGESASRIWYWREVIRNGLILTRREVFRTPVRTFLMTLACLIAMNVVIYVYLRVSYNPLPFRKWDPLQLLRDGNRGVVLVVLQFVAPLCSGWLGAKLLPSREWALALMFTTISTCVPLAAAAYASWANVPFPDPLPILMIVGNALRILSFCLGCLLARRAQLSRRIIHG